ncbi:MAG: hypothetical protein IPJ87_06230 [Flavobacteriales bacterium]|nr:hypothetical protein [Flavobacteriales bacterium]MBK7941456.1 hypothetical protein [Flavobacteriales bacterium]MBK9701448.1 hypothetical protein [Flavobacteriales bacterium]
MHLDIRPYRLRFKRPFGTAHGLRDGTDSVLIRVRDGGLCGYGEATTPPYVNEDQAGIVALYRSVDPEEVDTTDLKSLSRSLDQLVNGRESPAARAGLHMAFMDLILRRKDAHASTWSLILHPTPGLPIFTLGISALNELDRKLKEANQAPVLKIKLNGSPEDLDVLHAVASRSARSLLLDANQGLTTMEQAMAVIEAAGGVARVFGLEQPFHKDDLDTHAALSRRTTVPVIADESVQGPEDLAERGWAFTGVNVKLMKCGGLDRALDMITWARAHGKGVMLGSMSESSLGCAAMAALGGLADLCDLDGPWLIANDPFRGFTLVDGSYRSLGRTGFGVEPIDGLFGGPFGT